MAQYIKIFDGAKKMRTSLGKGAIMKKYLKLHGLEKYFEADIEDLFSLYEYERGDFICNEGEKLENFIFLVEGKVKVSTTMSNGKSLLSAIYRNYAVIGDIELITESVIMKDVQAAEKSRCLLLDIEKAKELYNSDTTFLKFLCTEMSRKLVVFANVTVGNILYPLENRVAAYILETSENISGQCLFSEKLTETADFLGTSYRHLLRTLEGFVKNNAIEKTKNGYLVKDEEYLVSLASHLIKQED